MDYYAGNKRSNKQLKKGLFEIFFGKLFSVIKFS